MITFKEYIAEEKKLHDIKYFYHASPIYLFDKIIHDNAFKLGKSEFNGTKSPSISFTYSYRYAKMFGGQHVNETEWGSGTAIFKIDAKKLAQSNDDLFYYSDMGFGDEECEYITEKPVTNLLNMVDVIYICAVDRNKVKELKKKFPHIASKIKEAKHEDVDYMRKRLGV